MLLLHNFEGIFVCLFFPPPLTGNNKHGLGKQTYFWFLQLLSGLGVSSAIKRRLFPELYLVFILHRTDTLYNLPGSSEAGELSFSAEGAAGRYR